MNIGFARKWIETHDVSGSVTQEFMAVIELIDSHRNSATSEHALFIVLETMVKMRTFNVSWAVENARSRIYPSMAKNVIEIIELVESQGHSGASFGCLMWNLINMYSAFRDA